LWFVSVNTDIAVIAMLFLGKPTLDQLAIYQTSMKCLSSLQLVCALILCIQMLAHSLVGVEFLVKARTLLQSMIQKSVVARMPGKWWKMWEIFFLSLLSYALSFNALMLWTGRTSD